MPEFRVTLDVSAENEDVVEPWAVRFLKDRGFNVTAPNEKWESVGDFKARLGISYSTICRKTVPTPSRPNVIFQRGPSKRIVALLSNPDFDAYCVANK